MIATAHPITQQFVTCDYVGDPYSCAKLGAHMSTGGLLGTWVKYNQNYFYLYPFLRNSLTGRSRRRIFTLRRRGLAKGCAILGICSHCSLFRGSKHPKPNFGARIGVFKPNSRNGKTCMLSKPLHRFQPNFAQ